MAFEIPQVCHSLTGHRVRVPSGAIISDQHVKADGVYTDGGLTVLFQNLLLEPPGRGQEYDSG